MLIGVGRKPRLILRSLNRLRASKYEAKGLIILSDIELWVVLNALIILKVGFIAIKFIPQQ